MHMSDVFGGSPVKGRKATPTFLFAERNNVQLACLLAAWLKEKGLD